MISTYFSIEKIHPSRQLACYPSASELCVSLLECACSFRQEDGYVEGESDGKLQEECLQKFSSRDYIMEPAVFNTLKA